MGSPEDREKLKQYFPDVDEFYRTAFQGSYTLFRNKMKNHSDSSFFLNVEEHQFEQDVQDEENNEKTSQGCGGEAFLEFGGKLPKLVHMTWRGARTKVNTALGGFRRSRKQRNNSQETGARMDTEFSPQATSTPVQMSKCNLFFGP